MNIKKIVLLASMVLAAIAFAGPAPASAEWTHEGEPLEGNVNISFTGNVGFFGAGGAAIECEVHAAGILEPGTTGTITSFAPTTNSCKGTGVFAGCVVESDTAIGLPWVMHTDTSKITITDVTTTYHFVADTPNCPIHTMVLHFSALHATPNNITAMGSVAISGTATSGAVTAGTLAITPAGTYGI